MDKWLKDQTSATPSGTRENLIKVIETMGQFKYPFDLYKKHYITISTLIQLPVLNCIHFKTLTLTNQKNVWIMMGGDEKGL